MPPLEERIPYLWFASPASPGVLEHDGGWVAETRTVGGLTLTVFSDDAGLRTRVLDSAGPSADGCPAEHAVTTDTDARRALTEDALKPLLAGPHQPGHLIGSVADLVWR